MSDTEITVTFRPAVLSTMWHVHQGFPAPGRQEQLEHEAAFWKAIQERLEEEGLL